MRSMVASAVALLLLGGLVDPPNVEAAGASSPSVSSEPSKQAPPAYQKKSSTKKKNPKSSSIDVFVAGYQAAYALIYDKSDYEAAIAALRALERDDNPDVATLLGYASRKLGRYDDAKFWYERALAADPNHAVTWSYYGMWHAEQGNVLKAKEDLEKVRVICGTECEAYALLKKAIEGTMTY
jgi:tetratricopeptide (TPR) repeat protein